MNSLKKDSIVGFIWRVIQNVSAQLMSFVIQIVLARLLSPSDFGLIAITSVFVTISNVFVQTGFTSAIVQKKEIDETDKSSMFYFGTFVGVILYFVIFALSPYIADFYSEQILTSILRVQSLSLIFSALSSVSFAIISRELQFRKSFLAGLIAYTAQGLVGITLAIRGYGVWALIYSTLAYNLVYSILIIVLCKWFPRLVFSISATKKLLAFSINVLLSNLLNTLYNSCQSLIVGKVYDTTTLGIYNKGNQFPSTLMTGIDGAMSTVMFSTLSKVQDDQSMLVNYLRKSMKLSLTVVVPMLCGLAAIADPLIRLLLTEKWIESVPFLMIYCLVCLGWPLSAKVNAMNAVGKSGINLFLNVLMKIAGVAAMVISLNYGVYAFALSTVVLSFIGFFVRTWIISKYFQYSIREQIFDVAPIYIIGYVMFLVVYFFSHILSVPLIIEVVILVCIGAIVYVLLSWILKMEGFLYIVDLLKQKILHSKEQ